MKWAVIHSLQQKKPSALKITAIIKNFAVFCSTKSFPSFFAAVSNKNYKHYTLVVEFVNSTATHKSQSFVFLFLFCAITHFLTRGN